MDLRSLKINILLSGVEQFRGGMFSKADGLDYVTLDQFVMMIRSGWKFKDQIEHIRSQTDKTIRNELKKQLPAFRPCIGDGIINPIVPIDEELGYKANIDQKHIVLRARSVSGNDLFSLIYIQNPDDHKHYNRIAKALNNQIGVPTNKGQHSFDRARYLSYDPYLYYNPNAEPLSVVIPEPVKRTVKEFTAGELDGLADKVQREILWLVEFKQDITGDYNQWRDLGFAFANTFHEAGRSFYHEISRLSDKYNVESCDRQYDLCDAASDATEGERITIGTFFHLVNETKNKFYKEKYNS